MEGLFPPLAIAVCGAHLRGEPLHDQLCGAELLASTSTSQSYKLFALDSTRPALVKCNPGVGAKIEVEVYKLQDEASLGKLLISIPQPLGLGKIELDDGQIITGFICADGGTAGKTDISTYGGWRAFKAATDDEWLCQKTAVEIVEFLQRKICTPWRLLDVVEMRIKRVNHLINAVVTTCFERARKSLEELEEKIKSMECPFPEGFLYGMPVLIKDSNYVRGVRFSLGFYFEDEDEEHIKKKGLTESDPLVLQIESMGGIVCGKTNLSEFAAGGHSFNGVFEMCVNPWDTRTSAGGSSGGAGSALAACVCWLAQGSDRGGSLRLPAHFNGVIGFRTSPGVVMQQKQCTPRRYALHSMNGPMARTVLDSALFLDTMTQRIDSQNLPMPGWEKYPENPYEQIPCQSWQEIARRGQVEGRNETTSYSIAFSSLKCDAVRSEVREICYRAAAKLSGTGSIEDLLEPFNVLLASNVYSILRSQGFLKTYGHMDCDDGTAQLTIAQKARIKPETRWNSKYCERLSRFGFDETDGELLAVKKAYGDADCLNDQVNAFFEKYDLLCAPVSHNVAFEAALRYPVIVNSDPKEGSDYGAWSRCCSLVSITGCPSIVLPVGTLDDLPVGMQIVGARGKDALVLQAAAALEEMLCLKYTRGCLEPRIGSVDLLQEGPRTAAEAEALHEQAQSTHEKKLSKYMS